MIRLTERDISLPVRLDRACVSIHTCPPFCMKELSYEDANNIFRCTDHHFMGAEPIRIAIRGRLPKLVYGHRFRLAPREARSYRRASGAERRKNQLSPRLEQVPSTIRRRTFLKSEPTASLVRLFMPPQQDLLVDHLPKWFFLF